jgi:alcohol dehydrogenase class IV
MNAVVRQFDELNHTLGIGRLKDRADASTVDVQLLAETIEHDMCFRSVPGNPTHDEVLNMVQQLYS